MSDHSSSVILKIILSLVITLLINTEIDFHFSISDQKDSRDSDEFKSSTYPSILISKLSEPDSDVAS